MGSGAGMPTEDKYGYDEYVTYSGSGTNKMPSNGSLAAECTGQFIKKHQDKPFFINLWIHQAHTAHYPKERFMKKFSHLDDRRQVYASVIAEGDEIVGGVIDLLKELDIDKNTLVVFSTDNGPAGGGPGSQKVDKSSDPEGGLGSYYSVGETGGLKGKKRSLFAGGIRVPFIVRWPDAVPAGVKNDTSVITAVDLLPTFLEAAGIDAPEDDSLDGESFLGAFKDNKWERSKPIFWEWKGGAKSDHTWPTLAVRYGDWKLLVDDSREKRELYNVATDWAEKENLADKHPEKLQELLTMLENWKQSLPTEPRANCLSPERPGK
eukprot:g4034.t1